MLNPLQAPPAPTTRPAPDASRTHRTVTAVSLAGSAVLVGVAGLVGPTNDGQADGLYDSAATAAGRVTAEAVVLTASSVLLVVGVLGAARVVRGRGRRVARAAALLGVMGALGHVAYATFSLVLITIVDAATDREAAVATLEAINTDIAIGLLVMPLIMAYALSVVLLPIAFHRGRLVPLWVVGLAATAIVLELVGPAVPAAAAAKYVVAAVATIAVARRITQLSDAEWRTPETLGQTSQAAQTRTSPDS